MPNGPELKAADLIRDGGFEDSGSSPLFYSFVAEQQNEDGSESKLAGYTISFYAFSTWQGKSFFLEDLYVRPESRKTGIGKKLFQANVNFAIEQNCSRFDFHVLNWNPAKKFYESLGAKNLTEAEGWEFYRLTRPEMDRLAANNQ